MISKAQGLLVSESHVEVFCLGLKLTCSFADVMKIRKTLKCQAEASKAMRFCVACHAGKAPDFWAFLWLSSPEIQ